MREALFVSAFSANTAVNLNIGGHKMNILCDIGMIGLGVMGRNLVLNMADHGFAVAGYNRHLDKVALLEQEAEGRTVVGTRSEEELAKALRKPRAVMMMVPAGKAVDQVIRDLLPHLEPGDLIIDGGNSHYKDTDIRAEALAERKAYISSESVFPEVKKGPGSGLA